MRELVGYSVVLQCTESNDKFPLPSGLPSQRMILCPMVHLIPSSAVITLSFPDFTLVLSEE